ncbi:MAG: sensor histidine kinase [Acidimicrobiia bacterium]
MTSTSRKIPPWAVDALLSVTLTIGSFVDFAEIDLDTTRAMGWREPDPLAAVLILVQTIPVAFRRRFPTTALVVASVGFFIDRNLDYPSTIAIFGLLFVFHAVGSEIPRRRALITGWTAIGLMTAFTVSGVFAGQVSFGTPIVVFIFTSFPFLLGLESRERRESESELAVRTTQLEFDKAEAVQQERVRIARELHDVVAHEMTVATIQASAARRLIGTDDEEATRAAGEAERAGHEGLVELRRLLGVLRTDEPASRSPQPGLDQLDSLADQMREAGLDVVLDIDGDRRDIPPGMDVNAYRIVQEALTNALKHAGPGVTAVVGVSYRPDGVEIVVSDDGRGASSSLGGSITGHGLIGMQERTAMLNGTFAAGPVPGGGFRVSATIPCDTT